MSDVAPVLGENRAIARLGLERIRVGPRPGLAALLAAARVQAADVDLETIGFVLAPRLNAAGRVGEALDAAHLLLATTEDEATELATRLEAANGTRRDLMREALAAARIAAGLATPDAPEPSFDHAAPQDLPAAIIVRGDWPVGIVGLVAGRLADETRRPAIVGTVLGDVVRASCRSDGRLDLAAALADCGHLLSRHGGHAAAAGFELPVGRWDEFVTVFQAIAAAAGPADPRRSVAIDVALPAAFVDYPLLRDLARLGPCGVGNPEPVVAALGLTVARVREATGGHTQLVLRRERDVLDAIAFGRSDLASTLREGDRIDVLARVASRAFGGIESIQLEVRDVSTSGSEARAAQILARHASRVAAVPAGAGA
ncbi:MAG: DHHA1 domain-containing protein [Chloroflexota bacterium]